MDTVYNSLLMLLKRIQDTILHTDLVKTFSVMKIITVGLKRKLSASENHIKEENCAYDK